MNEQDLPIDIHVGKLVDWAISRRHVKREWTDDVRAIREKINNAIQDMPEHPEVTKLLSGTFINYFHCLKIIEILKETEKDSKNFLGWYGSQRMKDWQEVVKLYERDSVYLAEAGHLLIRNVQFEIPFLKRMITKGKQTQEECDTRHAELGKGIAESKKRYLQLCKQIGITGDNVKAELLSLLKTLPEDFAAIAEETKNLAAAREFYSDFISFTITENHSPCTPLLKFLIEHGNVTTYEWEYGEPPCSIEEPQSQMTEEPSTTTGNTEEIDFGDGGGGGEIDFGDGGGGGGEIDFGDDLATGEIDWGNLGEESEATIDWGIGEEADIPTVDIKVEESGVAGGMARGTLALSILDNPATRAQLLDELNELEGFLGQRLIEMSGEEHVFSNFNNAPSSVQYQTAEQVEDMLEKVQKVLALLSTTKMHNLLLISSSPRYVDRLAASLQSKLSVGDKLAEAQVAVLERKAEAAEEQRKIMPKLRLIISRTCELQQHISDDISKRYKNRPVNIMGAHMVEQWL